MLNQSTEFNYAFIDTFSSFVNNGAVISSYYKNNNTFNEYGYAIYSSIIKNALNA